MIRREFDKKNVVSLNDLYIILSQNPKIPIKGKKLRHRIRSTLNSLNQQYEIIRIEEGVYKKSDKGPSRFQFFNHVSVNVPKKWI